MREIAKEGTAVRVVAHVLNDGAPIRVSLRPAQVFFGRLRIFFQKQRLDVGFPSGINDGFMRKDGISLRGARPQQCKNKQTYTNGFSRAGVAFHFLEPENTMVSNPLFRIKPSGKMKREERVIGREGNSANQE